MSGYYIVMPDLQGHDDSSKPQTSYQFADYIND
ncbi:MAG: alpha/beta fold hydrolase [cyanobacterium endosymbiont of Rhopalodia inflata]